MKVTVFTSNQPRHLALIESLAAVADGVFAVQECTTAFPGQVDDFYRKSDVMQRYFSNVINAEAKIFGASRFLPEKVRTMSLRMGDLSRVELDSFGPALNSDVFIVFGASYIKGPLCDYLVSRRACNIHMGVSPYYRGSSCNFWAMFDRRPELVGATIHLLTKGLDSGPMLCHARPEGVEKDPFVFGMLAVKAAHQTLIECIKTGRLQTTAAIAQDKSKQIRYTKNADFTDAVAEEYLKRIDRGEVSTSPTNDPPQLVTPQPSPTRGEGANSRAIAR